MHLISYESLYVWADPVIWEECQWMCDFWYRIIREEEYYMLMRLITAVRFLIQRMQIKVLFTIECY
jgi:hypothetical protein